MVIFIDTNVIIDFLSNREMFAKDAELILDKCHNKTLSGYVSSNTICDVFYILRTSFSIEERKKMLLNLCEIVRVTGLEHESTVSAITNDKFDDLEDCLQNECAEKIAADYIITRDVEGFAGSLIPAITPSDFLRL